MIGLLEVNNGTATSAAFTADLQAMSPGFLRFGDDMHIAAEHAVGSLLGPPQVTIGDTAATVKYAGVISPGLYQINVVVPSTAANDDSQVIVNDGAVSSPTGAMIPVSR